jgi:hypothetical protein
MDCQTCDIGTMHAMIADALECNLEPVPIVYDLTRLAELPKGTVVEWGNEPDGDIWPFTYRARLNDACDLAQKVGVQLLAPAISNLDWNSLLWLAAVRRDGWPPGLAAISAHRYGDGTFAYAHPPFESRAEEVARLRELCDGRPFWITEFGYPTGPGNLTEEEQATAIAQEWQFWSEQDCVRPCLYQINDGLQPGETYGLRRCNPNGSLNGWKPAAYQIPTGDDGGEPIDETQYANLTPNHVFHQDDLIPLDGRPGEYSVRFPPGSETILSPKINGQHELRPVTSAGSADDTCQIAGDFVYYPNVNGQRLAWRLLKS